jgi:hypothetical protein
MTLVDSDAPLPGDVSFAPARPEEYEKHPLVVDVDDADDPSFPNPKTPEGPLVTSNSQDTASTQEDSEFSPASSPEQVGAAEPTPALFDDHRSAVVKPTTLNPVVVTKAGGSRGETIYSLRLPGVGKILALKSEQACDVDDLYEENRVACDVDAYVDEMTDDDDSESVYPTYTSSSTEATGFSNEDDLEAGNHSAVRRIDPPLDTHSDPFAQRVGKKLSWYNVNMTLVRCESNHFLCSFSEFISTSSYRHSSQSSARQKWTT